MTQKAIYGHPVCKKCFYKFANRRQLGYLVDSLVFVVPNVIIILLITALFKASGIVGIVSSAILFIVGLALTCVFCLRDGIDGRSPGKRLTDLVVLNESDLQPVAFAQSFKRNCILLMSVRNAARPCRHPHRFP